MHKVMTSWNVSRSERAKEIRELPRMCPGRVRVQLFTCPLGKTTHLQRQPLVPIAQRLAGTRELGKE